MSKQDKATAERNARTLREMVKRPENKVCADCKRNDPRWASWNIGVFICIRCSGIHRGMGTHISKVKSVDLDMWTPEQIQSVQKWGNERANRYWEAHLKLGHIPPDHKIESFIRSKYESRRWARDGPPPEDPSVLDSRDQQPVEVTALEAPAQPAPPVQDLRNASAPPSKANPPRQHTLLSTNVRSAPLQNVQPAKAAPSAPPAAPPISSVREDLFSLDFTPPSSNQPATQRPSSKDFKNDIMSLFSSSAAVPPINNFASGTRAPQPSATTSLIGQTGTAQWGVQSGWSAQLPSGTSDPWGSFSPAQLPTNASGAPVPTTSPTAVAPPHNIWGSLQQPAQQPKDPFGSNVWGSSLNGTVAAETGSSTFDVPSTPAPSQQVKKDDAFEDIWGGFK